MLELITIVLLCLRNNGQDTDKAVRVLLLGGHASNGSRAGSGDFGSPCVRIVTGKHESYRDWET